MEKLNLTCSLRDMVKRVESMPKSKFVYSGIKENSVGFVFGPSKCGKTICCENLGMSIAAGLDSFLDQPINIENRKVLFISLEEFYQGRTERNILQLSKFSDEQKEKVYENYIVANENVPRYISSDEDWDVLKDIIREHNPGLVIIDSLSRLYDGVIEDSKVAKKVMKNLRELSDAVKTTIIIIHHTPKMQDGAALTVQTIAGSRMIGQEADFAIGINKTITGIRYVKDVFFRYSPENDETVRIFEIDNTVWLNYLGDEKETKILSFGDGRINPTNTDLILESFPDGEIILTGELKKKLVSTKLISKQTLHTHLKNLVQQGQIQEIGHGQYKKAA